MEHALYNRLGRVLWVSMVLLLVLLAVYVSAGRMLTANLSGYRDWILRELNERVPFTVHAQQVRGEWRAFSPVLVLTQLRVTLPGAAELPLELSQGQLRVDVLNSLRTRSLQLKSLVLDGLSLHGELGEGGKLRLLGFGGDSADSAAPLREFLLNIESIVLRDNRLLLALPNGAVRNLGLELTLSRDGSERRAQALLTSTAGARITVLAEGLGDIFRPEHFAGKAYVRIHTANLRALRDLLVAPPKSWVDGAADLELWLAWDRGEPTLQARLEARDLRIASPDAPPLQRLALDAQLLRHADHWSLFVSNLHVVQGAIAMTLPRLQLDHWGTALRLRAADVPLEPVAAILAQQPAIPAAVRASSAALRPRGRLPLLQASIGDMHQPSAAWEAQLSFADVAVDSWHGAPGATAASGYARVASDGASVGLDSRALSLEFPDIYRAPLRFDELRGTLRIGWDADAVRLDSGLLTARGEEGVTKVLFGLDIPLRDSAIGIEMDLLVGLQDSHARYRDKYIPYVLDPALLSWLAGSIGEGSIEQGAFLWRGSLRSGAEQLRTVQLAFNVADTQMSYHPQWPPVTVHEGTVLINDSAVSVWATRASLFESHIKRLSVETRVNQSDGVTLDISGRVRGPAADGFRVLNESPLAGVGGGAFGGWTATGDLDTQLAIHLNLGDDATPPRVDVTTRWRDVDLLVMPGKLPLQSIDGEFGYSTRTGFSSRALTGTLWGKSLAVGLRQRHGAPDDRYDPSATEVDIDLATELDIADLRDWLSLDFLSFASGRTALAASIRLVPGAAPLLALQSDLSGVSLDLPQPLNKTAPELRPLQLQMPLAGGAVPLSLTLAPLLELQLHLDDGRVSGGALGVGEPPDPVSDGDFRIRGRVPMARDTEWLDFASRYAGATLLDRLSAGTPAVAPAQGTNPSGSGAPLVPVVEALHVDSLIVLEQELQDVVFSLAPDPQRWNVSLRTDWLRADLALQRRTGVSKLVLEHIDLDRLPDFGAHISSGGSAPELPAIDVEIGNLFRSGKRLGHLDFELQGQAGAWTARNITGELAGLHLSTEPPGQLVWHRGQWPYTQLQASVRFEDLGQTLAFFDYQRIVQTEHGSVAVDLRWPGAPQDFALSAAAGNLQVSTGPGSFLEANAGASGALRVVSILNLADIVRRLSLSNMFESGIPFDSVDGEIDLGAGILRVARMDVKGGSSFQFSGTSDVRVKTIDAEMVATLPVASNLPWIAALAASLPVAAGVYVVSQVFDQQMSRLSSAVYAITGTWQDPQVNFDRIFDDSAPASGQESTP